MFAREVGSVLNKDRSFVGENRRKIVSPFSPSVLDGIFGTFYAATSSLHTTSDSHFTSSVLAYTGEHTTLSVVPMTSDLETFLWYFSGPQ